MVKRELKTMQDCVKALKGGKKVYYKSLTHSGVYAIENGVIMRQYPGAIIYNAQFIFDTSVKFYSETPVPLVVGKKYIGSDKKTYIIYTKIKDNYLGVRLNDTKKRLFVFDELGCCHKHNIHL